MLSGPSQKVINILLQLDDDQIEEFTKSLTPQAREYLDVIIEKYLKELG